MDKVQVQSCIDAVRAGRTDVYGQLVAAFYGDIWKVAAAALRNISETENIVQQTFVDAYVHLDQYRDASDFGLWTKTIARNLVLQELRRRAREDRRMELYRQQLESGWNHTDADDVQQRKNAALELCRQGLKEDIRQALQFRYERGLSLEEVAARLGKTVESSQKMLSRARLLLRACIEKRMTST